MDLMDLQKTKVLILPYHFSNLEVRNYYQNGPRFNGCYSRNNLPFKVKDWAYVTNLDGYVHIGPHWIVLHALGYNGTCFESVRVKHIPKGIRKITNGSVINASTIPTNIFRTQAYDLVVCRYFCITFIHFVLDCKSWKTLLIFFCQIALKNDDIVNYDILNYFKMDEAPNMYPNLNDQ